MTAKMTRDDNLAPRDILGKLTGERTRKQEDKSRRLQGQVVTTRALSLSGLTKQAFGKRFADRQVGGQSTSRSNLEDKWLSGETLLSRSKAKFIDRDVKGTLHLYDHSIFPLLRDSPLSLAFVEGHLEKYRKNIIPGYREWSFPDDDARMNPRDFLSLPLRNDSSRIVHRHDLDGFTVVLGLVREAEARGDIDMHVFHLKNLYRCLPAILAIPWFNKHSELLCSCVEAIQTRILHSAFVLRVEWDWIHTLSTPVQDAEFLPVAKSLDRWRDFERNDLDVVEIGEIHFAKPPLIQRLKRAVRAKRKEDRWSRLRAKVSKIRAKGV